MSASKCAIILLLASPAAAFFGSKPAAKAPAKVAIAPSINGWSPDQSAFAYGLPGAIAPFGTGFDPAGLTKDIGLDEMKRYREAEVTHSRVAMLAALGFLVGENFHPLFGLQGEEVLAIDSLTEVRLVFPQFFEILTVAIGAAELTRASLGWLSPGNPAVSKDIAKGKYLNPTYYPGDIGFDPLGLKPGSDDEFAVMQTKELQNGRLAMIGVAGMVAQELVDHKPILFNDFGFGKLATESPLF